LHCRDVQRSGAALHGRALRRREAALHCQALQRRGCGVAAQGPAAQGGGVSLPGPAAQGGAFAVSVPQGPEAHGRGAVHCRALQRRGGGLAMRLPQRRGAALHCRWARKRRWRRRCSAELCSAGGGTLHCRVVQHMGGGTLHCRVVQHMDGTLHCASCSAGGQRRTAGPCGTGGRHCTAAGPCSAGDAAMQCRALQRREGALSQQPPRTFPAPEHAIYSVPPPPVPALEQLTLTAVRRPSLLGYHTYALSCQARRTPGPRMCIWRRMKHLSALLLQAPPHRSMVRLPMPCL
jgi:hypothetical protein